MPEQNLPERIEALIEYCQRMNDHHVAVILCTLRGAMFDPSHLEALTARCSEFSLNALYQADRLCFEGERPAQ
jgi:response regulator RpfG family c-di-GMP phosphodiesterase